MNNPMPNLGYIMNMLLRYIVFLYLSLCNLSFVFPFEGSLYLEQSPMLNLRAAHQKGYHLKEKNNCLITYD